MEVRKTTMDERIAGKVSKKQSIIAIAVFSVFLTVVILLSVFSTGSYRTRIDELTAAINGAGLRVVDMQEDPLGSSGDIYDGRLEADCGITWHLLGGDHIWGGLYNTRSMAAEKASGISKNAAALSTHTDALTLAHDPYRSIYHKDDLIVVYEGGDILVYAVLEKLFGKPIASGWYGMDAR